MSASNHDRNSDAFALAYTCEGIVCIFKTCLHFNIIVNLVASNCWLIELLL